LSVLGCCLEFALRCAPHGWLVRASDFCVGIYDLDQTASMQVPTFSASLSRVLNRVLNRDGGDGEQMYLNLFVNIPGSCNLGGIPKRKEFET
jgi:hypothetical protein